MAHIERTIEIAANRQAVWAVVADLQAVSAWNPNVASASGDGELPSVGAQRTCHFNRGGHIDEVVSEWVEGRRIQFAIGGHGGIRSADMGTELSDVGDATRVTATVDYHLAFGPLGPVIDRVVMKRQMAKMLDSGLAGLKQYVEQDIETRKEMS